MTKVAERDRHVCASPPIFRMSNVPVAWLTEPEPRKSSALKNACVKRWKIAATIPADAEGHHHVPELADRRVGQHALDVRHDDPQQRRDDRRDAADQPPPSERLVATLRTPGTSARRGRRRPRPSSPRGSARRPASGLPSRPAARRAAGTAPTCPPRRRRCRARTRSATVEPISARRSPAPGSPRCRTCPSPSRSAGSRAGSRGRRGA